MSFSVNPTENEEEGDPLHILLRNCLKTQQEKVMEVKEKLKEEGVSYEDMIGFSEKDLRDTLGELQIKSLFIGRIIKYLKTTQESAVFQESKNRKFVKIYVSPQENEAFANLAKLYKNISDGSNNVETAMNNLELNRQNTVKSVEAAFNILYKDLENRKTELIKQTNDIAKRQKNVLNEQLNNLTKYRNELQTAKKEYHSTLENELLSDHDRCEKNINDINKAINSKFKYDITDPMISDKIVYEYSDQYKILSNYVKQFGSIIGSIKAPTISVDDIKYNQCKVTVTATQDTNTKNIKVEKYEIKYDNDGVGIEDVDDDEKKIDDINGSKVFELDGNKNNMIINDLLPESKYKFCVRAYYEQFGFTNYSNIIEITTAKKGRPLCWDRNHNGGGITFVSDQRIKYAAGRRMCIADYIVKKENHDVFEWSVKVHKYSNASWIGFVDAKNHPNFNQFVGADQSKGCSFGEHLNGTSLNICGNAQTKSSVTTTALKIDDVFKFVADMNGKEVTLYHNGRSLGVLWKNVFDELIPAASNANSEAEYTINGTALS